MDVFVCPTCTAVSPPATVLQPICHFLLHTILWTHVLIFSGETSMVLLLELARLYQAYADITTLHSIAFTACFVFQVLLLQKPHVKSKAKDHITCLERRVALWHAGNFLAPVKEGNVFKIIFNLLFTRVNSTMWLERLIVWKCISCS